MLPFKYCKEFKKQSICVSTYIFLIQIDIERISFQCILFHIHKLLVCRYLDFKLQSTYFYYKVHMKAIIFRFLYLFLIYESVCKYLEFKLQKKIEYVSTYIFLLQSTYNSNSFQVCVFCSIFRNYLFVNT